MYQEGFGHAWNYLCNNFRSSIKKKKEEEEGEKATQEFQDIIM